MTSEDRATQSKVGTFILIGLITIAVMVVYFGRLGEGVASYYDLRVEFPNASGLLRGAEVFLPGHGSDAWSPVPPCWRIWMAFT